VFGLVIGTGNMHGTWKLLAISEMGHTARPVWHFPCSQVRLTPGATERQYSVADSSGMLKSILCLHQPLGLSGAVRWRCSKHLWSIAVCAVVCPLV